jgi:hypothetical protein
LASRVACAGEAAEVGRCPGRRGREGRQFDKADLATSALAAEEALPIELDGP